MHLSAARNMDDNLRVKNILNSNSKLALCDRFHILFTVCICVYYFQINPSCDKLFLTIFICLQQLSFCFNPAANLCAYFDELGKTVPPSISIVGSGDAFMPFLYFNRVIEFQDLFIPIYFQNVPEMSKYFYYILKRLEEGGLYLWIFGDGSKWLEM